MSDEPWKFFGYTAVHCHYGLILQEKKISIIIEIQCEI